jgi:hypothetical protein
MSSHIVTLALAAMRTAAMMGEYAVGAATEERGRRWRQWRRRLRELGADEEEANDND